MKNWRDILGAALKWGRSTNVGERQAENTTNNRPNTPEKVPSKNGDGLFDWEKLEVSSGRCPDCGGTDFLEGPSGGMMTNYMCANAACGSKFNIGGPFMERISEPKPFKQP